MKLVIIIMITCLVQVSAASFGQTLTYSKKGATLNQIFNAIKSQTGYNVFFSNEMVDKHKKIDVNFSNAELADVMNELSIKSDLEYKIDDRNISVKPKTPSFLDRLVERFANIDVRGKVLDEKREPLVGATVAVKGKNRSVKTDQNGAFFLDNVGESDKLVISFIGYQNREVDAASDMGSLTMVVADAELEEVKINAGYYSVTDRERTGNIFEVTSKEIETQPISNPLQALQNRVPGLIVEQQSGIPGSGFKVQVRGRNSINQNVGNDPLYIIDGVIFPSSGISSSSMRQIFTPTGSSPLSYINVSDIESIEVLKDADATAIYGSRGANGVIIITTKKGKVGRTKVSSTISHGYSEVSHRLKLLNTEDYISMRKEAFENDNLEPSSFDFDINGTWDSKKYTDWQKELIGNRSKITNAQLNVSGGGERSNYILSGNHYNEGTVFPGELGFNRSSIHTGINFGSLKDRFKAGISGSYHYATSKLVTTDVTQYITLAPNAPDLLDENGKINWENNTVYLNPMAVLMQTNNSRTENLIGNINLSYRLGDNLFLKTTLGYTTLKREEVSKLPLSSIPPDFGPSSLSRVSGFTNNFNNSLVIEPQLTYKLDFGVAKLDALVGGSLQDNESAFRTIAAIGFNSDELMENIGSANTLRNSFNSFSQYRYVALFSRVNYSLLQKYYVNFTARRDGSSRFGDGKQFANFGAIGAAWIFSEEALIKDHLSFLSFGKLRASYGITGNDQISDYGYLQLWKSFGTYQGLSTLNSIRIANPDYAWEINRKAEAALQLGFLKDNITLEVAHYRNRTSNQLIGFPIPLSTGNSSIQANMPALVQNTGWEFQLNAKISQSAKLKWSISVNATIPKNKLIEYPGGLESSPYANDYILGFPLTISKTYNLKGVNQNSGEYEIEDKDSNGTLNSSDRYMSKFIGQKFYGGIQNTFQLEQFDLSFLISFNKQNGINFLPNVYNPGFFDSYGPTSNQLDIVSRRWKQPGDLTSYRKYSTTFDSYLNYYNAVGSTSGGASIVDASYIRLKNISLSYNLPTTWCEPIEISNAKFILQGQNVFTLTNYLGLDPESQNMQLPPLRTWTLGINLTF